MNQEKNNNLYGGRSPIVSPIKTTEKATTLSRKNLNRTNLDFSFHERSLENKEPHPQMTYESFNDFDGNNSVYESRYSSKPFYNQYLNKNQKWDWDKESLTSSPDRKKIFKNDNNSLMSKPEYPFKKNSISIQKDKYFNGKKYTPFNEIEEKVTSYNDHNEKNNYNAYIPHEYKNDSHESCSEKIAALKESITRIEKTNKQNNIYKFNYNQKPQNPNPINSRNSFNNAYSIIINNPSSREKLFPNCNSKNCTPYEMKTSKMRENEMNKNSMSESMVTEIRSINEIENILKNSNFECEYKCKNLSELKNIVTKNLQNNRLTNTIQSFRKCLHSESLPHGTSLYTSFSENTDIICSYCNKSCYYEKYIYEVTYNYNSSYHCNNCFNSVITTKNLEIRKTLISKHCNFFRMIESIIENLKTTYPVMCEKLKILATRLEILEKDAHEKGFKNGNPSPKKQSGHITLSLSRASKSSSTTPKSKTNPFSGVFYENFDFIRKLLYILTIITKAMEKDYILENYRMENYLPEDFFNTLLKLDLEILKSKIYKNSNSTGNNLMQINNYIHNTNPYDINNRNLCKQELLKMVGIELGDINYSHFTLNELFIIKNSILPLKKSFSCETINAVCIAASKLCNLKNFEIYLFHYFKCENNKLRQISIEDFKKGETNIKKHILILNLNDPQDIEKINKFDENIKNEAISPEEYYKLLQQLLTNFNIMKNYSTQNESLPSVNYPHLDSIFSTISSTTHTVPRTKFFYGGS